MSYLKQPDFLLPLITLLDHKIFVWREKLQRFIVHLVLVMRDCAIRFKDSMRKQSNIILARMLLKNNEVLIVMWFIKPIR